VLSIGKMVVGSEAYYLSMVAEGREEYYTGARGARHLDRRWHRHSRPER
jgi:hypothetical protein